MEETINETEQFRKKIQEQFDEYKTKFDQLGSEIQILKSSKSNFEENIKMINGNLQEVSKNVENIINRIDELSNKSDVFFEKSIADKIINFSIKKIVKLKFPLRKIAVRTISSIFTIVDKTMEATSTVREGFEDIVAEAHCEMQKKRMPSVEES